jgi:hypothetical protein
MPDLDTRRKSVVSARSSGAKENSAGIKLVNRASLALESGQR